MSEQVTIDEIVKSLREAYSVSNGFNTPQASLALRIIMHGIAPPEGYVLVPVKDCLFCKNTGIFGMGIGDAYDPNALCICVSRPQSRYNVNKTILSAVEEKDNE